MEVVTYMVTSGFFLGKHGNKVPVDKEVPPPPTGECRLYIVDRKRSPKVRSFQSVQRILLSIHLKKMEVNQE